ncbi:polysaccharide biosynthesis protein [Lactiplantibacillus carotarum]|uniref:polysaccharide biosynthesis protein n=1 Tax=Lactiplantibacillus carotarum TaxID=2993456 RepID=UPI00298F3AA2|nr:polysaccharide biosynthesis protein [Lactiplantibacillus carotarum]
MKYGVKERLQLALRWLPIEILVIVCFLLFGWVLPELTGKNVYQAQAKIKIVQRLPESATIKKKRRSEKQDVKNISQFSVLPHQSDVLYQASEYAYVHYGIWQSVQDLSESVSALPGKQQPILNVVVVSSSATVAEQNLKSFQFAITQSLKDLKNYQVAMSEQPTIQRTFVMRRASLKLFAVTGLALAIITPYLINYVREEVRNNDD